MENRERIYLLKFNIPTENKKITFRTIHASNLRTSSHKQKVHHLPVGEVQPELPAEESFTGAHTESLATLC